MAERPARRAEVIGLKKRAAEMRRMKLPQLTPDEIRRRNWANVAALALAAILIAVGWVLVNKLGQMARLQDCVMSGRSNCAPIQVPPRRDD